MYSLLKDAVDTVNAGATSHRFWDRITGSDDRTWEEDFIPTVITVDKKLGSYLPARMGTSGLGVCSIIGSLAQHAERQGIVGGMDGLCTYKGIRVSDFFNQMYYYSYNAYMLAANVFCESDTTFATIEIGSGGITFTKGSEYGDGEIRYATGTYFAATQLKVIVDTVGGVGPGMASKLDVRLVVKDQNFATTSIDVSVPAGSIVGYSADIGTTTDRFLSVTNASFYDSYHGTVGDKITIHNKKERTVAL
jgi:hypothetical protein